MHPGPIDCLEFLLRNFARALSQVTVTPPLVLQVVVPGRPECRAHYTLGKGEVAASSGFADAADVTLSIQAPELERLARGDLDLEEAMTLDRLRFFGARSKLDLLTTALRNLPLQSSQ